MATTYTLIDKAELTSSQSSISFTSIPSTYTDLKVVVSARNSGNEDTLFINFNSSSGLMSSKTLYAYAPQNPGSGSTSSQNTTEIGGMVISGYTSNTFGNAEIYIPNYTSSNYKSYSTDTIIESNGSNIRLQLTAGLWSSTSAITEINLTTQSSQNFVQYTSAYLYGITNS